jgi:hypothetical protein
MLLSGVLLLPQATVTGQPSIPSVISTPYIQKFQRTANQSQALTYLGFSTYVQSLIAEPNTLLFAEATEQDALLDIRWFGAVPDDANDDSAALIAALAVANVSGNTRIHFPAGTYYIDSAAVDALATDSFLVSADNVEIFGDGSGTVISQTGTDPVGFILARNVSGLRIHDLSYIGNSTGDNSSENLLGSFVWWDNNGGSESQSGCYVERCYVENCNAIAWIIARQYADYDMNDFRVTGCRFQSRSGNRWSDLDGVASDVVRIYGTSTNTNLIQKFIISDNWADCRYLRKFLGIMYQGHDGQVYNNFVLDCGVDLATEDYQCYAFNYYGLADAHIDSYNNRIINPYSCGFYAVSSNHLTFTNNYITGQVDVNDGALLKGAYAISACYNVTVLGGRIEDCKIAIQIMPYAGWSSRIVIDGLQSHDCNDDYAWNVRENGLYQQSGGVTITNCHIDGSNLLVQRNGTGGRVGNVIIANNIINGGKIRLVTDTFDTKILNNLIYNTTTGANIRGIDIGGGWNLAVEGNTLYGPGPDVSASYGIVAQYVYGSGTFRNNTAIGWSAGYYMAYVGGSFEGNRVSNCGTAVANAVSGDMGRDSPSTLPGTATVTATKGDRIENLHNPSASEYGWFCTAPASGSGSSYTTTTTGSMTDGEYYITSVGDIGRYIPGMAITLASAGAGAGTLSTEVTYWKIDYNDLSGTFQAGEQVGDSSLKFFLGSIYSDNGSSSMNVTNIRLTTDATLAVGDSLIGHESGATATITAISLVTDDVCGNTVSGETLSLVAPTWGILASGNHDAVTFDPNMASVSTLTDQVIDVNLADPNTGRDDALSTAKQIDDYASSTYQPLADMLTELSGLTDPNLDAAVYWNNATKDFAFGEIIEANDTAYSNAWNGDPNVPTKNVIYDYLHLFDADDDGSFADEAWLTAYAVTAGNYIDVSGQQVSMDPTEVEAVTWGAGGNASNIWSFNLSGTDTTLTLGSALFTFSHALTSGGTITSSGTFDVTGATGMILGSGDVTSLTITTDGTGNGELSLPADSIGDADIDWGTGAGQVSPADAANEDIGDITITGGAWAVEDDSHAHTTTTISGLDVTDDLNLSTAMSSIDLLKMSGDAVDANTAAIANNDTKHLANNDQIYDFVTGLGYVASLTYFPDSNVTDAGNDTTAGSVSDLQDWGSGIVTVQEASGAGPLTWRAVWSGVSAFDTVVWYGRYQGSVAHNVVLELYNKDTTNWDQWGTVGHSTSNSWSSVAVFDATHYINSGAVQVRIRHTSSGNTAHYLYVDYMSLRYGGGGAGVSAHNTLTGLQGGTASEYYHLSSTDYGTATDSTIADIADGTIAENLVNTANPWADDEVVDTLTISAAYMKTNIGTMDPEVLGPLTLIGAALPTPDGWWKCDDNAANTNVADSSGNSYTLTSVNNTSAMTATGVIGTALNFDGSTEYARRTSNTFTDSSGSVTAWVKMDTQAASNYVLVSSDEAGATKYINCMAITSGGLFFYSQRNADVTSDTLTGNTVMTTAEWYHLACTSNGSTIVAYVNGIQQTLTETSGSNSGDWFGDTADRDNLVIGALYRDTVSGYFDGVIDDVRVYSETLTPDQVKYLATMTGTPEGYNTRLSGTSTLTDVIDAGAATSLEIPNSNDPDLTAAGQLSQDNDGGNVTNDVSIRGYDGTNQFKVAGKLKWFGFAVIKPNDMADATRDKCPTGWTNESGMTFTVVEIKAWADTDDTDFTIKEYDADGASNAATVDAVQCTTGSGPYTADETTITGASIEAGHTLFVDFDDTDDPGWVQIRIGGWFNSNVD